MERRLKALGKQYPWRITLAADEEGYTYFQSHLAKCKGRIAVTDNGGGEVTPKHLDAVFNSRLGYGAFTLWSTAPDDIEMIRSTLPPSESAPQERDTKYPVKTTYYITADDIEDFAVRFKMTDDEKYVVTVGGAVIQGGDHLLDIADDWIEVPVCLCQVGPRQAPVEMRRWLDQHDQDRE
ncbi:hypothetical protein amb3268 [Paramagnetospirillum magneticum AMB-1]|uniref:Uncharacterized protein n=2 Tax=Paramagnetospirillum magneticum TaxID=84159 RepID=Q2W253_PARM1|nr:hypothetical protein amb3268 [Paramagnetospirillum magneticum AMB-1]